MFSDLASVALSTKRLYGSIKVLQEFINGIKNPYLRRIFDDIS
jgi:hypothetical protein